MTCLMQGCEVDHTRSDHRNNLGYEISVHPADQLPRPPNLVGLT
ncbi:hypothetical protein SynBIOSU31_01401 [Synechococcus sp. BIOS-U3-1]|nr:hypothetical protein SynBIOSU31_01401 [Synechococcus sp. BIOS-U3-1]